MIRLPLLPIGASICAAIGVCSTGSVRTSVAVRSSVAVRINVIVDIDVAIDVYVRMVASAPATPMSPVAIVCNDGASSHSEAETNRRARHRVIRRVNIARIRSRITRINHRRIILQNINDIWLR